MKPEESGIGAALSPPPCVPQDKEESISQGGAKQEEEPNKQKIKLTRKIALNIVQIETTKSERK